jgi:hypothetical protein
VRSRGAERDEPERFRPPLVGHGGLSSESPGELPRAFATPGREDGRFLGRAQVEHLPPLSAPVAPLRPEAPAPPPPGSEFGYRTVGL